MKELLGWSLDGALDPWSCFQKNTKVHQMDTRNQEIFNVNNANTARLQQSPIIYMQNLLNQNAKNNI